MFEIGQLEHDGDCWTDPMTLLGDLGDSPPHGGHAPGRAGSMGPLRRYGRALRPRAPVQVAQPGIGHAQALGR